MVLTNNLRFSLDEILPIIENLPIEEKTVIVQRLINKPSALNTNYLYGSAVGHISIMSRDELSDTLEAIANRIAMDGNIFRK